MSRASGENKVRHGPTVFFIIWVCSPFCQCMSRASKENRVRHAMHVLSERKTLSIWCVHLHCAEKSSTQGPQVIAHLHDAEEGAHGLQVIVGRHPCEQLHDKAAHTPNVRGWGHLGHLNDLSMCMRTCLVFCVGAHGGGIVSSEAQQRMHDCT
eukprot:1161380-Pelagomonas_calceolata.AAC.16